MSSIGRDLVFLVLQYLHEKKFEETAHKLERESGLFFNMSYFEESVLAGDWEAAERYLSGFTKFDDNPHSTKIYFEIRKRKYFQALDRHDKVKAVDILVKDLSVFSSSNEDIVKELTLLLPLDNFRKKEELSEYEDTQPARVTAMEELKWLIEANPLFSDKLQFPPIGTSRLRTLTNQSLNWQHLLCKYPSPRPHMETLFVDHCCPHPNFAPGESSRAAGGGS
uniref:Topless-related protein 1-like n=1 Tax=Elaeis guineensis var. tenera TaxID=51953 RepID=A0A6I9QCT4_ELAGV|nr:topless-related protein 1-like [Elaeis guineensis]